MLEKKILIIRFSSIGDIVLTTPVSRCLKKQTASEIHYLTKASFESLLISNPNIDKVHTFKKNIKEVIPQLKKEQFDLIIDLHKNIRSTQVIRALKLKSINFDKINWQKWLMVNLKWNYLPKLHIVDRYLKSLQTLGIQNDGAGLDYFIPKKDEVVISEYGLVEKQYIAIVVGAAHFTKRILPKTIKELCKQLPQTKIVLLGGKEEKEIGAEIASAFENRIINFCGKLNLNQSASIIQQSNLIITADTGLMHIAAALQKKMIVIWGNTIPEFGMYPYFKNGVQSHINVESNGLSCRPCSKIGFSKCP
ncbi:MAG TPA: lipopolysaccharide heptosyltransferase family protein, partial [Bacteroidetes bacterium]|nr:lipopolysaccharide heptosyltransferase family protein [Bacteroidota bacterium]